VYPVANMLNFTAKADAFSKIDLQKGRHQISVHPANKQRTAITTSLDYSKFKRKPCRLRSHVPDSRGKWTA
jgi:hypothetical protein